MIDAVVVFEAAQAAFDQRCASCTGLVPGTPRLTATCKTWKQVWGRATHAAKVWNENYGPLTDGQWDYATALVVFALTRGPEKAPTHQQRYAFFNQELTGLLHHEKIDVAFKARVDSTDALGDVIGEFDEVAA